MARPAWTPATTATSKTSDSLGSPPCSMVVVALAGLKFVMMSTPSSLAAGSPGGRVLVRARGWQPAAGLAPAKSPGPAENVEVSGVTPGSSREGDFDCRCDRPLAALDIATSLTVKHWASSGS